jgi:SAM-dependent methyltransferase
MRNIENVTLKYLEWAPMSLAIREVTRINFLYQLEDKFRIFEADKILDVGCGDGNWWKFMLPEELHKVHGIDISRKEIEIANSCIVAKCLDITSEKVDKELDGPYGLIIGNCSLEHIYHLDKALKNIYQLLEENGKFCLFVPTPYWALKGKSIEILSKVSPRLSMAVSGLMNGFFQHWHLYHYKIWESVLTSFGFKVSNVYGIGNKRSEFLFRLFLPSAFISFLVKSILGKYLNFYLSPLLPKILKKKMSNMITMSLDKEFLPPNHQDIFEYVIVCRK